MRDNAPYNPNSRVNKRSQNVINSVATYVHNATTMNENHASTNNEHANRYNRNRTAVAVKNNSNINNNSLLNDDNNIGNHTITRDENNESIDTFTNSEGRIAGVVEEDLQAAIVQGTPDQGYPPSPNYMNFNLNHDTG